MKVTKEQFYKALNESNFNGNRQVRDIMPSASSIKFENDECKTTWKCQKNEPFIFGWTITKGIKTEYFLNKA